MGKRYLSIWFRQLKTDWFARKNPALKNIPFVLASPDHGRMMVAAANSIALKNGVTNGMTIADARAIIPSLEVLDDQPEIPAKLLNGLAEWCIRFTPLVAVDLPDALLLDVSGCAHLWKGETAYLTEIHKRFHQFGYYTQAAMADTIGCAWAVARCKPGYSIVDATQQRAAMLPLPVTALRIALPLIERLEKLGLRQVGSFIDMPRPSLRRRFGPELLTRMDQALGITEEILIPVQPVAPYAERLPCLEPIATATGIEIALTRLLDVLCSRLSQEEKGLRSAIFKGFRVDGKIEQISIGTNRPSANSKHLFKLFEDKIATMEPALGIELFTLEAPKVEELSAVQEKLWEHNGGLDDANLALLLDRVEGKLGSGHIHRYLPAEHYWPENSFKESVCLNELPTINWQTGKPRPLQLLPQPQQIEVTAPVPDYPPMNFRYKGKFHKITRADGPERIEQEWWLQDGRHRDYYYVEDEAGMRYWLFRLGHYEEDYKWFVHGFFS